MTSIRTSDILTPRSVMLAFQKDKTVHDVISAHDKISFSRIPVFGESRDDVIGVALKSELIEAFYTGGETQAIVSFVSPLHAVPDSKTIADLLDEFLNRREHMFLVVDEYGGTAGIVTLEDAIETLLGVEIVDEFDSIEDMRAFALDTWKKRRGKRGMM